MQEARINEAKHHHGSNVRVALEKLARYFKVEARILDVSENS